MKKLSFYVLAIVGLLFAACMTDRDVAVGEDPQNELGDAEGYMSLNINLPSQPSVRAANDDFADGTANEYRVHDCGLLLFEGADPNEAKFLNAQEISLPFNDEASGNGTDNITTSYVALAEVSNYTKKNNPGLWGLVVINYKNLMEIEDEGDVIFKNIKGESSATTKKLSKGEASAVKSVLRGLQTNANLTTRVEGGTPKDKNRYFFMTNAVLSTKAGGEAAITETSTPGKDATVVQLAYIDPLKIYHSKAEAISGDPAGEILVERAVAKATLKYGEASYDGSTEDDAYEVEITNVEWAIDNTEPSTFVLRNPGLSTDGTLPYLNYYSNAASLASSKDKYRFVGYTSTQGNTNIGSTSNFYRIYWCVDPQYDKDAYSVSEDDEITTTMVSAYKADGSVDFTKSGEDNPLYCYENTFDVERQKYGNTTRAILKVEVQLKKGASVVKGDLYALNNDGKIYTKESVDSRVAEKIMKNIKFEDLLNNSLAEGKEYATLTTANFGEYFRINYTTEEAGKIEFASVEYIEEREAEQNREELFDDIDSDKLEQLSDDIADLVNTELSITKYKNGVMYYEARFMHFGDDLTPWNKDETPAPTSGTEIEDAYGENVKNRNNNYLGRYGMVRNNWYDVKLTSIARPGYPTVADTKIEKPDTPDDKLDDYIKLEIHVLSWAKRTQNWGF